MRSLATTLASRWHAGPHDVIALLAPNCPEFVISYFAIVSLGAIVQPIDERLASEEIREVLLDSNASVLMAHHALRPKYEDVRKHTPAIRAVTDIAIALQRDEHLDAGSLHPSRLPPDVAIAPGDPAELVYTSGTAGRPKPVLRSHASVLAGAMNSIRGFGYRSDDVIAITMPMSHSSALTSQMLPLIQVGGRLVLFERFDVPSLLHALRAESATCMRGVPAMLRSLLATPHFCSANVPSLRLIINSSAPIAPQTYAALKQRFPGAQVMNSYGLTEASTCTVLPDAMARVRPDSVGRPIAGVEMRIVDETGQIVGPGVEGEIWVRGDHVFLGYRHRPEQTRSVLVDGWLRTGDLGRRDPQGFYYLHGRKDDLINCGGRKISPLEVELCILQMPEVAEVAVVGEAHRILGQVVKALVVLRQPGSLDPKQVIRHCARTLASHKVPFSVESVPELPKSSLGKTLRPALRTEEIRR